MEWYSLLRQHILDRGIEYYEDGYVADFAYTGNSIKASVNGSDIYDVEVILDGEDVLPLTRREVRLPWNEEELTVLSVAPLEIFASKTVALLTRTAPRDLYDMYNMVKYGLFDESEETMFRKCAAFYSAIGAEYPPEKFEFDNVGNVSKRQIKRDLDPVLRKGEKFDLEMAQKEVCKYLARNDKNTTK